MAKILVVDPTKCTGCRICELVCSVKNEGVASPARARIGVVKWEQVSFDLPMVCQQCESPLCAAVCPVNALSRDEASGAISVNYDLCVGCRMCLAVCPFGAIRMDVRGKRIIKCDLCGGEPTCVSFCYTQALQYIDPTTLDTRKKREAAEKLAELMQKFARGAPRP